ncbi:MAG: hypothetical protein IJQ81_18075 [Oscillibacter sp.]|nr:hypothetical protein [Oscillibacter sp.]
MTLNASDLVQQFENRLRELDDPVSGRAAKGKPFFPMMVARLGPSANNACLFLRRELSRLWPQYRDEIAFVSADLNGQIPEFSRMASNGDVSDESVSRIAAKLFDANNTHFFSYQKLLIYYVLNTSDFQSADDLRTWLSVAGSLKVATKSSDTVMDMLILLLNEDNEHTEMGAQIRETLAHMDSDALPKILILSNRRNDNGIDLDWRTCHCIAAATIAVSNQENSTVVTDFFRPGFFTVSYVRAEKPFAAISQLCVNTMLEHISNLMPEESVGNLFQEPERLSQRLGLSPDATFSFLDEYVENSINAFIPDGEALNEFLSLFPIREPSPELYAELLSETSAKRFNDMTFGAWDCYLETIVKKARDAALHDAKGISDWRRQYGDLLRQEFTAVELEYLSERVAKIRRNFMRPSRPLTAEKPIRIDAKKRLCFLLSQDEHVIDSLCDEIKTLGEQARICLQTWDALLKSQKNLHLIQEEDQNFISYYKKPLTEYFFRNAENLRMEIRKILDVRSLKLFFQRTMDHLFAYENLGHVFSNSFGDVGAVQDEQTRRKLNSPDIPLYLSLNFSLGAPVYSFLLLKVDNSDHKSLYHNLKSYFSSETFFYDTGSDSAAEVLNIFRVNPDQLL